MPSGSRVALGIVGIGMGGLVMIGSVAGTLAAALAGLFDPSILEPATSASGGIGVLPGPLGGPKAGEPSTGGNPALEPGSAPSPNPVYPTGPFQITPPEPPALPPGGLPELPPAVA